MDILSSNKIFVNGTDIFSLSTMSIQNLYNKLYGHQKENMMTKSELLNMVIARLLPILEKRDEIEYQSGLNVIGRMQLLGLQIQPLSSDKRLLCQNHFYIHRYPNYAGSFVTKEFFSLPLMDNKENEPEVPKNDYIRLPTSKYLNCVCMRNGVLGTGKRDLPNLIKSLKEVKSSEENVAQQLTFDQSLQPVTFHFSECSNEEINVSYPSAVHFSFSLVDEAEFKFHEAQSSTDLDPSFSCSFNFVFTESFFFVCSFILFLFVNPFPQMDHIERLANLKHQLSIEIHKLETAVEENVQVRNALFITFRLMNNMTKSVKWKKKWKIRLMTVLT